MLKYEENGLTRVFCDKCKNEVACSDAIHFRNSIWADYCKPCAEIKRGAAND